jgi:hypothetical protein
MIFKVEMSGVRRIENLKIRQGRHRMVTLNPRNLCDKFESELPHEIENRICLRVRRCNIVHRVRVGLG